jgi:hypothetical protein
MRLNDAFRYCMYLLVLPLHLFAQNESHAGFDKWFDRNVKIGQSMETADQRDLPAQFLITVPLKKPASYLIDMGVSVRLSSGKTSHYLSKLICEYHRNTFSDSSQNNFQLGYGYTWRFAQHKNTDYLLTGDAKYLYDQANSNHSAAANILFTWLKEGGNRNLNWNTFTFYDGNKKALFLSLFSGAQIQQVINSKDIQREGFILRPLYSANVSFSFIRKDTLPLEPKARLSIIYTGRIDAVHSSRLAEGYTDLVKAGADWYFAYNPLKLSLGVSFNSGSDPLLGLKKQTYWLMSFNFSK